MRNFQKMAYNIKDGFRKLIDSASLMDDFWLANLPFK